MNDDDLWIDAGLDGELDAAASLEFQRRLDADPSLKAKYEARRELRAAVRQRATYHEAPEALQRSLQDMLAASSLAPTPPVRDVRQVREPLPELPAPARRPRPRGRPVRGTVASGFWRSWSYAAGGAVVATLVTLRVVDPGALHLRPAGTDPVSGEPALADAAEAVSAHTRALLVDHPIEVASSDQHTVKPWLSARLNFSPPVVDLAPQGYALLGARRDVLAGETAAALVYRHGAHVISVFVRPLDAGEAPANTAPLVVRGFNVLQRTHDGMAFCLVSDMNVKELGQLADLVTAAPSATPGAEPMAPPSSKAG